MSVQANGFSADAPRWHEPCYQAGEMIDPIFQSGNYQLASKLLDASALRQQAIAANIANAETPGYRRLDVAEDFLTQLKASVADGQPSADTAQLQPKLAADPHARTVRPDGNSVEVEHELIAMNRNAVEYEFLSDVVTRNIKQLKVAITGRNT